MDTIIYIILFLFGMLSERKISRYIFFLLVIISIFCFEEELVYFSVLAFVVFIRFNVRYGLIIKSGSFKYKKLLIIINLFFLAINIVGYKLVFASEYPLNEKVFLTLVMGQIIGVLFWLFDNYEDKRKASYLCFLIPTIGIIASFIGEDSLRLMSTLLMSTFISYVLLEVFPFGILVNKGIQFAFDEPEDVILLLYNKKSVHTDIDSLIKYCTFNKLATFLAALCMKYDIGTMSGILGMPEKKVLSHIELIQKAIYIKIKNEINSKLTDTLKSLEYSVNCYYLIGYMLEDDPNNQELLIAHKNIYHRNAKLLVTAFLSGDLTKFPLNEKIENAAEYLLDSGIDGSYLLFSINYGLKHVNELEKELNKQKHALIYTDINQVICLLEIMRKKIIAKKQLRILSTRNSE